MPEKAYIQARNSALPIPEIARIFGIDTNTVLRRLQQIAEKEQRQEEDGTARDTKKRKPIIIERPTMITARMVISLMSEDKGLSVHQAIDELAGPRLGSAVRSRIIREVEQERRNGQEKASSNGNITPLRRK